MWCLCGVEVCMIFELLVIFVDEIDEGDWDIE